MITIKEKPGRIEVEGHAFYDRPGRDIVCAAVSTLTQNLIYSIKDLTEDVIKYETTFGRVVINYRNPSKRTKLLIDSFFVGIKELSDSYPEHIRVIR